MLKTVPQGPDLQNLATILRLSYDNANVTIDDGRLINALNDANDNSFSNQWVFTMLETEVFKYKLFKVFLSQKLCCLFC